MKGGTIRATVRFLIVFAAFIVWSGWATKSAALEGEIEGESISGVQAVAVLVMPMTPDAERYGLNREQIFTDIQQKLRKAEIRILTDREIEKQGFPYLDANINVEKDKNPDLYRYDIKIELYTQYIINPDDAAENIRLALYNTVKSWSLGAKGTASGSDVKNTVQKQVNDIMDKFIHAYFAANPKEGSQP
jgi:hypothetical protein